MSGGQGWLLPAAQRIGRAVDEFDRARATAREIVRLAPGRRSAKAAVARAEQSAADFVTLTSAVLTIGSLAVAALEDGEPLPAQLRESIAALRAALATAAEGGVPGGPGPAATAGAAAAAVAAAGAAAGAEHALPASISNAAVIASLAARCAALTGRAADPEAGHGQR